MSLGIFLITLSAIGQDSSFVAATQAISPITNSSSWTLFIQKVIVAIIPFLIGLFIKRPSFKKQA
jgi:peptidoglycan/LPS O-acetylase OafA/YrhL